ncbi:MAG: hypothetical protein AAGD22_10070 [Verrucomicrobiota bacterium]
MNEWEATLAVDGLECGVEWRNPNPEYWKKGDTRMKVVVPIRLVVLLMICFVVVASVQAQTVQQTFEEGKALLYQGDTARAAEKFREVLKRDPRHTPARFYLAKATPKPSDQPKGNLIEARLAQVVVPSVDFNEAPLGDVILFVGQKTAELTNGAFRPNIVYTGPQEDLTARKITLKLSGIPMSELLRYVGELSSTRFKYGNYAIEGVPAARVQEQLDLEAAAMAEKERKEAAERAAKRGYDPFAPKTDSDPFQSYLK